MESRLTQCLQSAATTIRNGGWNDSGVVPPFTELGRYYGISAATAGRMVKRLCSDGLCIQDSRSRRYYLQGHSWQNSIPQTDNGSSLPGRVETLAEIVKARILKGEWTEKGHLPSTGKLRAELGCSHYTLVRVLKILADSGYIHKTGRYYYLCKLSPTSSATQTWVFCRPAALYDPVFRKFTEQLEHQLRSAGWGNLELAFPNVQKSPLPDPHTIAGLVMYELPLTYFANRAYASIPKVYIHRSDKRLIAKAGRMKKTCTVTIDQKRIGIDMARHLYSMGHRHIAFISPHALSSTWVRQRVEGLKSVFNHADQTVCSVSVFCNESKLSKKSKSVPRNSKIPPLTSTRYDVMKNFLPSMIMSIRYRSVADWINTVVEYASSLKDVFAHLIDRRDITAWVCDNDSTAFAAYRYRQLHTSDHSPKISLTGCDNLAESRFLNMTTYEEGALACAKTTAACLVQGITDRDKAEERTFSVTGTLVIRGSSQLR